MISGWNDFEKILVFGRYRYSDESLLSSEATFTAIDPLLIGPSRSHIQQPSQAVELRSFRRCSHIPNPGVVPSGQLPLGKTMRTTYYILSDEVCHPQRQLLPPPATINGVLCGHILKKWTYCWAYRSDLSLIHIPNPGVATSGRLPLGKTMNQSLVYCTHSPLDTNIYQLLFGSMNHSLFSWYTKPNLWSDERIKSHSASAKMPPVLSTTSSTDSPGVE